MRMRRLSRASAAKTRSPTAESSMFTRPLAAQGRPRRSPDHNTPPADVTAPPPRAPRRSRVEYSARAALVPPRPAHRRAPRPDGPGRGLRIRPRTRPPRHAHPPGHAPLGGTAPGGREGARSTKRAPGTGEGRDEVRQPRGRAGGFRGIRTGRNGGFRGLARLPVVGQRERCQRWERSRTNRPSRYRRCRGAVHGQTGSRVPLRAAAAAGTPILPGDADTTGRTGHGGRRFRCAGSSRLRFQGGGEVTRGQRGGPTQDLIHLPHYPSAN